MSSDVEMRAWQPRALRVQALELAERLGHGPAAYFRLVEVENDVRYANMEATGEIRDTFVRNDGAIAHQTSVARQTSVRSWTAGTPRSKNRNRFMAFEEDYGFRLSDMVGTDTHRAFYGPCEVNDQVRALMYDGDEFLGFVAVMRRGREFFGTDTIQALQGRAPEIHRLLLLARAAERDANTGALHVIADEQGGLLYADERSRCWLTDRRAGRIRAALDTERFFVVDGLAATVGWLDDGHRKLRHIALSPVEPLRASRWHHLSETQRDIVALALDGLSNREIARLKGISSSTVKYHLNESARLLDVSGRQGLRRVLSNREGM